MRKKTINWKKLLSYNIVQTKSSFSEIPSTNVDPERLLAGLPAFETQSQAETQARVSKAIILPPIRHIDPFINPMAQYVKHLKHLGFDLYYLTKRNSPVPLNSMIRAAHGITPPPKSVISQVLNIPADKIHVFTLEDFEQCLSDAPWEWEHYDTFTEINLRHHPITDESMHTLLEAHGDEIQVFDILDCQKLDGNVNLSLLNPAILRKLHLQCSNCDTAALERLLNNTIELEELTLSNRVRQLHSPNLRAAQLPKLKRLTLNANNLTTDAIQQLLEKATQLEELNLVVLDIIESLNLANIQLQKLKILNVDCCNLSTEILQHLLENAHELEELNLTKIGNIESLKLSHSQLRKLKKLTISHANINTEALQQILENAPELEALCLGSVKNLASLNLNSTKLRKLKKLTIHDSQFNVEALQHLLDNAPDLEVLELVNTGNHEKIKIDSNQLRKLKKLWLSYSSLPAAMLKRLLENATELEELLLADIRHSDLFDLNNDTSRKLKKIHITHYNIPAAALQRLLENSTGIENLYIYDSKNLASLDHTHIDLPHLKKLYLDYCNPPTAFVESLIRNANKIEKLHRPGDDLQMWNRQNQSANNVSLPPTSHTSQTTPQTIDANTGFHRKKKYHLDQQFIGKHRQPHPSEIRLTSHTEFTLNQQTNAARNPFILTEFTPHQLRVINHQPSPKPLYDFFTKDPATDYFGRFRLTLTKAWQRLPSISAQEYLRFFYIDPYNAVEIAKSDSDGFYYVRLPLNANKNQCDVTMEVILQTSNQLTINHLPNEIRELIRNCRGYRDTDLTIDHNHANAQDYLNAIINERTGACRHRAIAFKAIMQQRYPQIPVQIITNACHVFVEIFHQGQWIACDLGGHDADVKIKPLPEFVNHADQADELMDPERVYQQTFSNRGRPLPIGYLAKLTNLTTFTLDHINAFPTGLKTDQLDTLIIKDAEFNAAQLLKLLQRTPALKTLKLLNIQMHPDEFVKLDFSCLRQIEYIELSGNFIPNNLALKQLQQTVPDHVRWAVDSPNVYDTEAKQNASAPNTSNLSAPNISNLINKQIRMIPDHRYFLTAAKQAVFDALVHPKKSTLFKTAQPEKLGLTLQQYCQKNNLPYFYIDQPSELICSKPIILNDNNIGRIQKGPGGALYDFLKAQRDRNAPAILVVNYANFKPADIAKFNSLLDSTPSVDGVDLPASVKVIGMINPQSRDCYQGSDFYSRFKDHQEVDTIPVIDIPTFVAPHNMEHDGIYTIELCGGGDWEARLLGSWRLHGDQLIFHPGKLLKALEKGYQHFVFNNPPKGDAAFDRFMNECAIHQAIYHRGRVVKDLPVNFQVAFTNEISFSDRKDRLHLNNHLHQRENYHILNSANISQFLGVYKYDNATQGLILQPGLIKQYRNKHLPIYLTHTLSVHQWLKLFELARKFDTQFDVRLAPGVTLPDELEVDHIAKSLTIDSLPHTRAYQSATGELATYPSDAIVIDVTELTPADLLESVNGQFNEAKLRFTFTDKAGFLTTELAQNKSVILKGRWSTELAQALYPVMFKRSNDPNASGRLIVVSDKANTFPGLAVDRVYSAADTTEQTIHFSVAYEDRLYAIESLLQQSPFVVLTGATGTGKTHFIEHVWKKAHGVHFGENAILDWIHDTKPGIKTLFIDEANLTGREWSEFSGLNLNPPAIFYQGKYYPLSPEHKVIFAGNPQNYGGERHLPRLFQQRHAEVEFLPIPHTVTLEKLNVADEIAAPILAVANYLTQLFGNDTLITPRELVMMAALTQATLVNYPQLNPSDVATSFAFQIGQQHVSEHNRKAFIKQFKPTETLPVEDLALERIILTKSNQLAFAALCHQLNLREARQQQHPAVLSTGGLGGLILEGEPGIGKSELIMDVLNARGMARNRDYYYLPVAMDQSEKEALLLSAFHEGKMVIIDEINSSPMMERLLNALLEGHDLQNKPAQKPGFLLLGTQNPIHFSGRVATTLPLKHRLETVTIPDYKHHEMVDILVKKQIPPRIAKDMVEEYLANKMKNSEVCFRDLMHAAKRWLKQHVHDQAIKIDIKPLPQVGSLCKIVSIASIEQYYAAECGYEALPLRANNRTQNEANAMRLHNNKNRIINTQDSNRLFSIRKLAKRNDSVQGEVLQFGNWVKNLNDLGYETNTIDFNNDFHAFIDGVTHALKQGNLPLIAFAVSEESGHPDPEPNDPEAREHATIISGYHPETDEMTIQHWGNTYVVDAVTLFNSSRALAMTRKQEFYQLNPQYQPYLKQEVPKYIISTTPNTRNSETPAEQTGFRGKLLVVNRPDNIEEFIMRRKMNLLTTHQHESDSSTNRCSIQ